MKRSRFSESMSSRRPAPVTAKVVVVVPRPKDTLELLVGERRDRETSAAVIAFNDYARMGLARSHPGLMRKYISMQSEGLESGVPTTSIQVLRNWSSDFGWAARCETYDAAQEVSKDIAAAEVLSKGLSLSHNRVIKLKQLAAILEHELAGKLWTRDVKMIGFGKYSETVEMKKLNSPLLTEYRKVLDDIAKEVGGRRKGLEISGPDGGPIDLDFGIAARDKLVGGLISAPPEQGEDGPDSEFDE